MRFAPGVAKGRPLASQRIDDRTIRERGDTLQLGVSQPTGIVSIPAPQGRQRQTEEQFLVAAARPHSEYNIR